MRRRALAMGAAVLAAAPILSCETMAVSASDIDDTALQEAFLLWEDELYNAFSLEGTIDALSWPVNVRDYYGQIAFLVEAIGVGGGEVSPGTFSGFSGVYTDDAGVQRHGTIYTYAHEVDSIGYAMTDPISVLALHDGVYYAKFSPTYAGSSDMPTQWRLTPNSYSSSDGTTNLGYSVTRWRYGTQQERIQAQWTLGNGSDLYAAGVGSAYSIDFSFKVSPSNIAPTWPGISVAMQGQTPILGAGITLSSLPTSADFPTVTADNVADYIAQVVNPALPEEVKPYTFDPFPTPPPTYPVQETWSNEADWPEGNLLPTIPAASYTVEIPQVMTEGVTFWWRCLGILFDGLGITAIVVGLLALGIVLYFVLR